MRGLSNSSAYHAAAAWDSGAGLERSNGVPESRTNDVAHRGEVDPATQYDSKLSTDEAPHQPSRAIRLEYLATDWRPNSAARFFWVPVSARIPLCGRVLPNVRERTIRIVHRVRGSHGSKSCSHEWWLLRGLSNRCTDHAASAYNARAGLERNNGACNSRPNKVANNLGAVHQGTRHDSDPWTDEVRGSHKPAREIKVSDKEPYAAAQEESDEAPDDRPNNDPVVVSRRRQISDDAAHKDPDQAPQQVPHEGS